MSKILSRHLVPGNKSAILNIMSNGSRVYHCRTHQNPVAYGPMDNLKWIELDSLLNTSSKSVNGIWLRDKNIMSVGIRQDGRKQKYLGIRPDDNQTGSEQFEISIERIQFDGVDVPVNIAKHIPIDAVTADLGNVIIRATRQGARQMVKVPAPIKHFKITFTIHFKGLDYRKREDLDEEWFYRKNGEFYLRLGKPLLIDDKTYEPLEDVQHFITHTVIDNHDGTLTYIKESTNDFHEDLLPESYLIDLDPIYSSTSDGNVLYSNATFSTCRDAATGSSSGTTDTSKNIECSWISGTSKYQICRAFFYYDTSGVVGTITSVTNYLYSSAIANSSLCAMKGTQADTLTTADYDSSTGNSYGSVAWVGNQYNLITFNAQGISDVNKSGTTKICVREYTYDYSNSTPSAIKTNGVYFSDNTGTDKDPYLSITTLSFKPKIIIF